MVQYFILQTSPKQQTSTGTLFRNITFPLQKGPEMGVDR